MGPPKFNPIQALRPPKFDLFGFLSLEKNDQIYPGDPYPEEPGGLLDPLLSLGMFVHISCLFTIAPKQLRIFDFILKNDDLLTNDLSAVC